MEITDKELLAICNLSNLKMEFAETVYKDEISGEERNHTISSLLEKEYNAIKENNIDKRAFLKKIEVENNGEKIEIIPYSYKKINLKNRVFALFF